MLQSIANIIRALGIIAFLVMCYARFVSNDQETFIAAKQSAILFFSISFLLWIGSLLIARRNR